MKITLVKHLGITLATFIILVSVSSSAQLEGFIDGAKWGNRPASVVAKSQVQFASGGGPKASELFAGAYTLIALCLGIYIILNLFWNRKLVVWAISVLTILMSFIGYYFLYDLKNVYLIENPEVGYYYWINKTTPLDRLCVIALFVLLVMQIAKFSGLHRVSKDDAEST